MNEVIALTSDIIQAEIMNWVEFFWVFVQHPLVAAVSGALGYSVISPGARKEWGNGIQKLKPQKGNGPS